MLGRRLRALCCQDQAPSCFRVGPWRGNFDFGPWRGNFQDPRAAVELDTGHRQRDLINCLINRLCPWFDMFWIASSHFCSDNRID